MIAAAVTDSLSALQTAITAAGTLANASPPVLAPVGTAAASVLAAIDAQTQQLEEAIDQSALGGIAIGMDVPAMVTTFVAQSQDAVDLSTLETTRGYVARLAANIANASSVTQAVLVGP